MRGDSIVVLIRSEAPERVWEAVTAMKRGRRVTQSVRRRNGRSWLDVDEVAPSGRPVGRTVSVLLSEVLAVREDRQPRDKQPRE